MEKLPMCRICLAENVRMRVVVNNDLHELYEKLTNIPFVTEDSRPILACFFCCAKLKQCYRLLRQCLEAEQLFAQMMNEDYEPNSLANQNHSEFFIGFIQSPIEHISIVDECQTESIAIKEDIPDACEALDDIIEPKEEHQSDELEPENVDNSCLVVVDTPPDHSESDLEYDVPLTGFKNEVEEEQEGSKKKRRARETKRATVAKKSKLDTRRTKLENAITAEQTKKNKSEAKVIRTTQKRTRPTAYFKEPYKCDQRSFNREIKKIRRTRSQIDEKSYKCDVCQCSFTQKGYLTKHYRVHTGEKPYKCDVCQRSFSQKGHLTDHSRVHTGEKPYECDVCQHSFSNKANFRRHIRVHTGENPYKCDICQRSFSQKSVLTNHIRKHTGEKPYKCDVCQRSFTKYSNLMRHIHIHTGEKPYKCNLCQRSFIENYRLSKHIREHTENLYKCDVCQRSFSKKRTLLAHIHKNTG